MKMRTPWLEVVGEKRLTGSGGGRGVTHALRPLNRLGSIDIDGHWRNCAWRVCC